MEARDIRQVPDAAFISRIRAQFPVEREIDRILTRKMERRAGPGYTAHSLETLVKGLHSLIREDLGDAFKISNARWLTGGASKIQVAFDLERDARDHKEATVTPMVMRMQPAESVVETSRQREFEILRAVASLVPVPPCYWCDATGEHLPFPALVYAFMPGVARPTNRRDTQVAGIGLNFGPELREALAPQFLDHLGRLHGVGEQIAAQLPSFDPVVAGSNESVIKQVNHWRRIWEEDRDQDDPLMEVAYQWLIRNAPPVDAVSIIHGDYRGGNFLFREEDAQITAWLDWELALLGDRHHDLAGSMLKPYRHMSEDGKTELISGFLPEELYLETYERLSGFTVNLKTLAYYQVLYCYLSSTLCSATSYRVARGEKTHQDVVMAWLSMMSHMVMEQLRTTLLEVA